jgi:hypothetical protein
MEGRTRLRTRARSRLLKWRGALRASCAIAFAVVYAWARPGVALAENVSAEALFRAGRAASARGDHATACTHYRESFRLENAPGTLLNLALCEEALGKLASAWKHYQAVARALAGDDERLAWTKQRLRALDTRVPRLTIHIRPEPPANTRVLVGTNEIFNADLGTPLPIDHGRHEISVLAPKHAPKKYTVELVEGESKTLTLQAGPLLESAPTSKPASARAVRHRPSPAHRPANAARGTSMRTVVGYSALGLGAAGLVTSAVTGALVLDRKATVDEHCNDDDQCQPAGLEAGREGSDLFTAAAISLAVGVVAGAAGFYLLWTRPDTTTGIVVQPGPSSAQVSLNYSF